MEKKLFHIFRNTPLGRETLLQSIYFCNQIKASIALYIPKHTKFLMYFENDVVQIDLDESYLTAPTTSRDHASDLVEAGNAKAGFIEPKHFTATTLPDITTDFDFMCCPRSISDLSSKIGLGYIGPRVRRIVKSARFPVLITSPLFKEWNSITVFFGGSKNAINAFKLGLYVKRLSGKPLNLFTHADKGKSRSEYEQAFVDENLEKELHSEVNDWLFFDGGVLEENLYDVPHDSLVVLGAYGHGLIKDILFGSKMEKIQATVSNNLLIVGPHYAVSG